MPRLLRVGAGGEPGVGGGPEVAVDLLPVDHPFVAFAQGARLQRGEIRARVGFGVAEGESHLTADDPWEPLELLFVGPEAHNRRPDRADAEAVEDVGHVPVVELLVEEEGEEPALALPSVLLGPAHGCVAGRIHRLTELLRLRAARALARAAGAGVPGEPIRPCRSQLLHEGGRAVPGDESAQLIAELQQVVVVAELDFVCAASAAACLRVRQAPPPTSSRARTRAPCAGGSHPRTACTRS